MKVVYGRKRIDYAALEADPDFKRLAEPVVALGSGLPEKGVAFAFGDWKEFVKFAAKTEAGDKIASMDERRRKLRKGTREDMTAVAARMRRRAERIESELRELSQRTGLAWTSKELFLRATTKADPIEGPIFDPSMLYRNIDFGGSALAVIRPGLPDLSWFPTMNNAVSSVQVIGVIGLFNNTWFRGAARALVGLPYFQIGNLAMIGFDNVTSSVLVE